MPGTPLRMFGPAQLTNAAATKYTATGVSALIRHVHVSNPAVAAHTFTMSIGADAAGTRIFDAYSLPAGSVFDWYPYLPLVAGEIVQAYADANTTVDMFFAGDVWVPG